MPSIDNAYPSVVVRHPSGVSRFNERFSDSSTSGYQAEPSKCGSCLQTLIKRLKANSDLQNGTLRSTPVYLRTTQSTVARRRSKGTPSATAAAYARRRSTAKQLAENHGHAKRAKQKHEKVQKQKSRLTGATWGYDPTAGRIAHPTSLGNEVHGCYIFKALALTVISMVSKRSIP